MTVAFLKLSGTDAAIESGALLSMLDELSVAVGRACETYGLTWLESDIDVGAVELYLTGGAPSRSGEDEEGMVLALRDVIAARPGLPLRAGVHRGHVFTGDIGNPHRRSYAVMGDAVNLAARLRGDVCERLGGFDGALAAYERARDLLPANGAQAGRIWRKIGVTLERLGHYDDARAALVDGVGRVGDEGGDEAVRVRAALEHALAGIAYPQAQYDEAIAHADAAIALAETIGDLGAIARASNIAGGAYDDLGREGGLPYLERAVAVYEELGDDRLLSNALNNLGIHHYTRGNWDESIAMYRRGREADERIGDPLHAAVRANNEAEVLSDQGRLEAAEPLFRELVRIARGSGFPIGEALGTSNLGRVAARAGRFEEAHGLYEDAERQFAEIGSKRYVTETRARVAEVLVFEGRHGEARQVAESCRLEARAQGAGALKAAPSSSRPNLHSRTPDPVSSTPARSTAGVPRSLR